MKKHELYILSNGTEHKYHRTINIKYKDIIRFRKKQ